MDIGNVIWLFIKIFLLLLVGYYLIPAGSMYYLFFMAKRTRWKNRRIQDRYPEPGAIRREIKWSILTVFITSVMATGLILLVQSGVTKLYVSIGERGWIYFIFSTLLFVLAYDTYFYWLHRFMHWRKVFPYVHRLHHMSNTPTPWAILAFNPLEAVLEFMIYPLALFLIPLHPAAVILFVVYNIVINTLGHVGHEIIPRSFHKNPLFRYSTTVTHHEMHHQKVRCNYGIYTTIWDRLMGTNHPDYESTYLAITDKTKGK